MSDTASTEVLSYPDAKPSYASPLSFTRATAALCGLVRNRGTWYTLALGWLALVPSLLVTWAFLLAYYTLAFTVFLVPFVVWRLWRRNERRRDYWDAQYLAHGQPPRITR